MEVILSISFLPAVCKQAEKRKFNVGVIGAGIGGASASHFLRELLNDQVISETQ